MKKTTIILILYFLSYFNLSATHNMAGSIVYKHISGLTYEATIITYTETSGVSIQADRTELDINWGDGYSETVQRTNYTTLPGTSIRKNTYTKTHIYSMHGNYTISMQDPNRNNGILNINSGNSVNVPFYLETKLLIPNSGNFNNSVNYLAPPILNAEAGKPFRYNLTAIDSDGDIITYKLITPKSNIGIDVPNYVLPDTTTIDFFNGEMVWLTPQTIGFYGFSVLVSEFRNGILVGSTIVDFQLKVAPPVNKAIFTGMANWPLDSNNNYSYTLSPNDTINISLAYSDSVATNVNLDSYSETITNSTAIFSSDSIATKFQRKNYTWTPDTSHLRCAPYIVTFRGTSTISQPISKDVTLSVFVKDASLSHCESTLNQLNISTKKIPPHQKRISTSISPNPFDLQSTVYVHSESSNTKSHIIIFDLYGNQVKYDYFFSNEYILKRNNLQSGVYIYKIYNKLGNSAIGKFILE